MIVVKFCQIQLLEVLEDILTKEEKYILMQMVFKYFFTL